MAGVDPQNLMPADTDAARPAGWAQRGIGSHRQHRFFYYLMKYGGRARGYHMANIATLWYALFYPSVRRRCRFYLDRRFPDRRGFFQKFFDTYRLLRCYGHTLVDMMVLGMFGPKSLVAVSPDHDRLLELAAGASGFTVLHAHVGCWQIGMSTLGELQKKVSILMIPEPRTTAMFASHDFSVIDPRTGMQSVMEMTESLLAGSVLALTGDRTMGDEANTAAVQFLGGRVQFPITPFKLASATGTPIFVLTAPKTSRGTYELRLSRVIEVPPKVGRDPQAYAPYVQQFAEVIEQFVMEYPWQFHNFYDLWNAAPPAEPLLVPSPFGRRPG